MKRFRSATCAPLLAGLALAAGAAMASDIYKWTDDGGTVHYGDRPTGAEAEQRLELGSQPTDPESIRQSVEARGQALAARDEAAAARAANEPTREELRAKARERAEKCTTYKDRLQKFVTSRRLYRHDENGERVYLDEEQTLSARARVQEKVEEYCTPE